MNPGLSRAKQTKAAWPLAYAALLSIALTAPVQAEDVKTGDLVITQPWTRATPGGAKVAGGYLTIENKGSTSDRLVSGSTNVAKKIQIHEMAMNDGVMTMRPSDGGLAIEPGKTMKLAPGGHHLMFLELDSPFKQGDTEAVTLKFEKAGEVKVLFEVQGIGAEGPGVSNGSGGTAGALAATVTESADENFFTHIHAEKAMANVTVSPGRAGPVLIMIQLETTDERPLIAKAVSVTLTNLPAGVEAKTSQAERGGDDQWRVKMSTPVPGRWMLGLGIVISDSDKVSIEAPILIK
jgi:copper(I)-binding protein